MAAQRKKDNEDLATPQKATPVAPPESNGAREIPSPATFFGDPRMPNGGKHVKNFAPSVHRGEPSGNDSSTSEEGAG